MADGSELAVREANQPVNYGMNLPSDEEIARMFRLAKAFYAAGIYKDIKQAEQAFAKLVVGRDLGLTVAQSMQGVQFVQGQIQLHYVLLALIIRSRGFSWETQERSDTRAAAKFFDPEGNERDEVEFSIADATRAGLTKPSRSGEPSMYTKYPRNMLWARMMSDAVRFVIPEATGGVPVYVSGEIVPTAELTEGEGTGEARGIELPPEVEEVVARAERLGHLGWAERATWEYRTDRGPSVLAASVREAVEDLDELERRREAEIPDADVEPDVPIDAEDLPAPDVEQDLGGGRKGEAVDKQTSPSPAAQTLPEEDIEKLRARRRLYEDIEATTEDEIAEKAAEIADLDERIEALARKEADDNPEQGQLV